jgi:hypothetical protein
LILLRLMSKKSSFHTVWRWSGLGTQCRAAQLGACVPGMAQS